MWEEKRKKQDPRLMLRWAFEPIERSFNQSGVVILSFGLIPHSSIEDTIPNAVFVRIRIGNSWRIAGVELGLILHATHRSRREVGRVGEER
jgi:hypothetical protein